VRVLSLATWHPSASRTFVSSWMKDLPSLSPSLPRSLPPSLPASLQLPPTASLPICLSSFLSLYFSLCLSVCMSLLLGLSPSPFLCLPVCPSLSSVSQCVRLAAFWQLQLRGYLVSLVPFALALGAHTTQLDTAALQADQMVELAREFEIPSVCLHSGLTQRRREGGCGGWVAGSCV
jgi:hypothetical protein